MDNVIIAICVAILALMAGVVVIDSKRPTIALKKDEWTCTEQQVRNTTTVVNTTNFNGTMGTAIVPTTEVVCVAYRRTK